MGKLIEAAFEKAAQQKSATTLESQHTHAVTLHTGPLPLDLFLEEIAKSIRIYYQKTRRPLCNH